MFTRPLPRWLKEKAAAATFPSGCRVSCAVHGCTFVAFRFRTLSHFRSFDRRRAFVRSAYPSQRAPDLRIPVARSR